MGIWYAMAGAGGGGLVGLASFCMLSMAARRRNANVVIHTGDQEERTGKGWIDDSQDGPISEIIGLSGCHEEDRVTGSKAGKTWELDLFGVTLASGALLGIIALSNVKTFKLLRKQGGKGAEAWDRGFSRWMRARKINLEDPPRRNEDEEARIFKEKMDTYWADFNERVKRMESDHERQFEQFRKEQEAWEKKYREANHGNREAGGGESSAAVKRALAILDLDPGLERLSDKSLKRAYLQACKKWHPDVAIGSKDGERFKEAAEVKFPPSLLELFASLRGSIYRQVQFKYN